MHSIISYCIWQEMKHAVLKVSAGRETASAEMLKIPLESCLLFQSSIQIYLHIRKQVT